MYMRRLRTLADKYYGQGKLRAVSTSLLINSVLRWQGPRGRVSNSTATALLAARKSLSLSLMLLAVLHSLCALKKDLQKKSLTFPLLLLHVLHPDPCCCCLLPAC